jgi:hypothetical protein
MYAFVFYNQWFEVKGSCLYCWYRWKFADDHSLNFLFIIHPFFNSVYFAKLRPSSMIFRVFYTKGITFCSYCRYHKICFSKLKQLQSCWFYTNYRSILSSCLEKLGANRKHPLHFNDNNKCLIRKTHVWYWR